MIRKQVPADDPEIFNLKLARWVLGVLGMLIGVVGKESLLGLILRQTRAEIGSLIRSEEQVPLTSAAAAYKYN
jgi:hypothetical protein